MKKYLIAAALLMISSASMASDCSSAYISYGGSAYRDMVQRVFEELVTQEYCPAINGKSRTIILLYDEYADNMYNFVHVSVGLTWPNTNATVPEHRFSTINYRPRSNVSTLKAKEKQYEETLRWALKDMLQALKRGEA